MTKDCDFCGVENPKWIFPAKSFWYMFNIGIGELAIPLKSHDEWYACDTCKSNIEDNKYNLVADRVLIREGLERNSKRYKEIYPSVLGLHKIFSQNRIGEPQQIED